MATSRRSLDNSSSDREVHYAELEAVAIELKIYKAVVTLLWRLMQKKFHGRNFFGDNEYKKLKETPLLKSHILSLSQTDILDFQPAGPQALHLMQVFQESLATPQEVYVGPRWCML